MNQHEWDFIGSRSYLALCVGLGRKSFFAPLLLNWKNEASFQIVLHKNVPPFYVYSSYVKLFVSMVTDYKRTMCNLILVAMCYSLCLIFLLISRYNYRIRLHTGFICNNTLYINTYMHRAIRQCSMMIPLVIQLPNNIIAHINGALPVFWECPAESGNCWEVCIMRWGAGSSQNTQILFFFLLDVQWRDALPVKLSAIGVLWK